MNKLFLSFLVISLLSTHLLVGAEKEKHSGPASDQKPTTRATESDKKPVSLAEKLSACLNERPSSKEKETEKPDTWKKHGAESDTNDEASQASGSALFTKHCASCHSPGASQGPIVDFALAAERAGTSMPPSNPSSIPSEELSILKDYLRSR